MNQILALDYGGTTMKQLNLDDLCPESVEITYKEKTYILEPLNTERLLEIIPIWNKYGEADEKDLAVQMKLAAEFIGEVLPEFPSESMGKLTAMQLKAFMDAILSTMGLVESDDEEVESNPKKEKS